MTTAELEFLRRNEANLEAVGDKVVDALHEALPTAAQTVTPDDAEGEGNTILPSTRLVSVSANTNGVNDFITLPELASVPNGTTITIIGNAAGCELRTPADSDEEINSENCDGTKEYAVAANNPVIRAVKIDDTIGWMAHGYTAIGAVISAVVPD